jgi:hypothetical protein
MKMQTAILLASLVSTYGTAQAVPTYGGVVVQDPTVLNGVLTIDNDCSGFLISAHFGITAGHCTAHPSSIVVTNGQTCRVTAVANPPGVDADHNQGDFTLMKIKCPSPLTNATFFALPTQDQTFSGAVTIAGFGSSDGTAILSKLQSVPATLSTNFTGIAKRLGRAANGYLLSFSAAKDGANVCMLETANHVEYHGDSGGPVYVKSGTRFMAISSVSTGLTQDDQDNPRNRFGMCGPSLAHYSNWIRQKMGSL